jgi:hypothetical protein
MEKVKIKQVIHNQNNIVLFEFRQDEKLIEMFKQQIQDFHWNQELQGWTSPTKEVLMATFWLIKESYLSTFNESNFYSQIFNESNFYIFLPLYQTQEKN